MKKNTSKNNISKKNTGAKEPSSLRILTGYSLFLAAFSLIVLVPLVMKNGYEDIDVLKFNVYKWTVIVGYGVTLVLAVLTCISEKKDNNSLKQINISTYFAVGYLIITIMSTLFSSYRKQSIWGFEGWYMGLFAQASFVILFLLHKYFDRYKKILCTVLLITAAIVYLFGILHRFNIDPLDTYKLETTYCMPVHFRMQFLSTIGQATWYSSFVAISLPIAIGIYILTEKKWVRVTMAILVAMGFMTTITQNSDSAYMALAGFITVYLCFSISERNRIERFIDICIMFLLSSRLMSLLYMFSPDTELELDKLSHFLIFNNLMWPISLAGIMLLVLIRYIIYKKGYKVSIAKAFRNIYLALLFSVIAIAVIILILDGNRLIPESVTEYIYKIPYLHWSEFWGSGRGKTWTFSLKMYAGLDLVHLLFGTGPDTYYYEAYGNYAKELAILWPEDIVSCAHNEWLNRLICEGLLGVLTYTGIFVSTIIEKKKALADKPAQIVVIAAIISYMCHNFFCYQQICSTPFIFMIMG